MKRIPLKDFIDLMQDAITIGDVRMRADDGEIELNFNADGQDVSAVLHKRGVHVDEEPLTWLRNLKSRRAKRFAQYRSVKNPSLEFLREHDLPLYWNREWIEQQLMRYGSFAEIARYCAADVHGVNATTMANYAREHFNIKKRRERGGSRRAELVEAYEDKQGNVTQTELASRFNVSIATVNRWLQEDSKVYHKLRQKKDPHGAKNQYKDREAYDLMREEVRSHFLEVEGDVNKSALAAKYGVERGTIASWTRDLEPLVAPARERREAARARAKEAKAKQKAKAKTKRKTGASSRAKGKTATKSKAGAAKGTSQARTKPAPRRGASKSRSIKSRSKSTSKGASKSTSA